MKFNLIYTIVLCIFLTSCDNKSKQALQYSNWIVEKEKELVPVISKAESSAAYCIENENYDSLVLVSDNAVAHFSDVIREIEHKPLPNVTDIEKFKKASIKYFTYIQNIYKYYGMVGRAKTNDERNELYTKMNDFVNRKEAIINFLQEEQKKFAKANHFTIK